MAMASQRKKPCVYTPEVVAELKERFYLTILGQLGGGAKWPMVAKRLSRRSSDPCLEHFVWAVALAHGFSYTSTEKGRGLKALWRGRLSLASAVRDFRAASYANW